MNYMNQTNASCIKELRSIININESINNIDDLILCQVDDTAEQNEVPLNKESIRYSYSLDMSCWSCYMDYSTAKSNTLELETDFYVRMEVKAPVTSIYYRDEQGGAFKLTNWTIALVPGFTFTGCDNQNNSNMFNPYANMDCAIKLQQQLTETVSCMFGIPCIYFKVNGVKESADITFKEYALKSVSDVKQLKLLIKDNVFPSSRPEFSDFGFDWDNDWEVEVAKGLFATVFGPTVQPMEGDLVYIPMMKRMWMVNHAYEEKNESLMWVASTFKLSLSKYQDDLSLDKSDADDLIDSVVKNKYEDLFGDQENLDSGEEPTEPIISRPSSLFPVYDQDATRKAINIKRTELLNANQNNQTDPFASLYYKGTLIADSYYTFGKNPEIGSGDVRIEYQRSYCGDELSVSFIVRFEMNKQFKWSDEQKQLFSIYNIQLNYTYKNKGQSVELTNNQGLKLTLNTNNWYLIVYRHSKRMNTSDLSSYIYKYPNDIPAYKLKKYHYLFDIDNGDTVNSSWNTELSVQSKQPVYVHDFFGNITNIKVIDIYLDDVSELMMQNPTSQHILINDTARPLAGLPGVKQF